MDILVCIPVPWLLAGEDDEVDGVGERTSLSATLAMIALRRIHVLLDLAGCWILLQVLHCCARHAPCAASFALHPEVCLAS